MQTSIMQLLMCLRVDALRLLWLVLRPESRTTGGVPLAGHDPTTIPEEITCRVCNAGVVLLSAVMQGQAKRTGQLRRLAVGDGWCVGWFRQSQLHSLDMLSLNAGPMTFSRTLPHASLVLRQCFQPS